MIVKKETLQSVLPACTKDDTRYFLQAVLIEPDGRCLATNGHVLLIATDPYPGTDEDFPATAGKIPPFNGSPKKAVLLPSDQALNLIKTMPKKSTIPILQGVQISKNGEAGATVTATDLQAVSTTHVEDNGASNRFPDYERVMPKADRPHVDLCLSVAVLETLIKSCKAATDGRLQTITFEIPTAEADQGRKPKYTEAPASSEAARETEPDGQVISSVKVRYGTNVKVEGVIMPCRV